MTVFLFVFIAVSCKKSDFKKETNADTIETGLAAERKATMSTALSSTTCVEDQEDGNGMDTLLKPTILGYHLVNHPYSLAIMQQAYTNLYGNANGVVITHKYIRFKPSSPQQLSILEDLDIDLSDFPLDYDVVQEGDFYNDGITPAEEIPWLYAVVDAGFTPPAGISYEVLEQIHIPVLAAVENESFVITGNPIDSSECGGAATAATPIGPDAPECPEGYHWDYTLRQCVENDCPAGYYWDGAQCVPDAPPPPAPTRQPSGTIQVYDNNFISYRPVRNARVVARRFLKIERTYTNNQGQFFINQEFRKVTLLVKFKNDQAKIRALRRARLWQMLFPVKIKMGKYKGALNNITYNIDYFNDALSSGARNWAAATAHNNVQEYYDFAAQQGIGTPPNKLRILLTNWETQGLSGAAPMYAKRVIQELPEDFLRYYVISNTPFISLAPWVYILKQEIDITLGYNIYKRTGTDQAAGSSGITETMFHELTHAAHYNKVGNAWWNDFVDGELNNIIWNSTDNPPYGNGDQGAISGIIATGESWAYHMGHFMTDLKYVANSNPTFNQGFEYRNGDIRQGGTIVAVTGLNVHVNLLEDFDNHRTIDPDRWISQGIYYDLIDNRNDVLFDRVLLDDQVAGYTNQQFFNALDTDIRSLPGFRVRLLNENGNNQAAGVNTIFTFYNVF